MTPTHNEQQQRFEIQTGSGTALLEYRRSESRISFTHTEVPAPVEGRGIGTRLVRAGLQYARTNKLEVLALCPFVVAYMERHPEE